jgi:hypothetical protein
MKVASAKYKKKKKTAWPLEWITYYAQNCHLHIAPKTLALP